MMKTRIYYILMIAMVLGAVESLAQKPSATQKAVTTKETAPTRSRVMIYGNVYGGGELAQVAAPADQVQSQLIQDSDLETLFTKEHTYTTYVHLGKNAEVYGKTFGGGKGHEDSAGESHGRVIGQTDVALDGATVWSELYGGGEMADVRGNSLLHFKKGKAGHNAFGGGLGLLGGADNLPDNQRTVLASADIKKIEFINDKPFTAEFKTYPNLATLTSMTGNTFVVFDGEAESYTHYEFKEARTVNRDANGKPELRDGLYYTTTPQYNPENESQLFSINHNIYGGGMTAAKVDGSTYMHINYGMVNDEMMNYEYNGNKVWSHIYNSVANAQFCVFGGGYGYYADVQSNTNVTMDIEGSHAFRYLTEFKADFDGKVGHDSAEDPEFIYKEADEAQWSHGAPGRSCMDVVGGGYNGRVNGTTNVTIGGDVVVRKVYGGGYYAAVDNTKVNINSGLFNRVYGGGMMGNVNGKATLTVGQTGSTDDISTHNRHLIVKNAIYGGNDVSGTVGTVKSLLPVSHNGVEYYTFDPVDDADHGVRLNVLGGLVLGDIYGAGNGNHPGYSNPDYMQFDHSQHPSENYRTLPKYAKNEDEGGGFYKTHVYKYRPRTGRVEMRLQGNEGNNFNDGASTDKLRIWGRTFGGGNSCNVGIWDGSQDDRLEEYVDENSFHPGKNFTGGGTIRMSVGSHVQFGNRNDSHVTPNGIFMGCNGEHMVTQHTDVEGSKTYHQYYDEDTKKYWPGFPVYQDGSHAHISREVGLASFKAFINNILTKSDNVSINFDNDVEDVWMSNFVGGGYRGSMQAQTVNGTFYYSLPKGVTVGHAVVGGAFNAHVIYRIYATTDGHNYELNNGNYQYEWRSEKAGEEGTDYLRTIEENDSTHYVRYNFDGGMMAHTSGSNASDQGTRCHQISNNGTIFDFTGQSEEGANFANNKELALVRLDLRNMMHPHVIDAIPADPEKGIEAVPATVHGGIVYGGCFSSGFVDGDSWVDYRCSLSPLCASKDFFDQGNVSLYEKVDNFTTYNALNIYGAGYGEDTHSMGDVYMRILHNGSSESNMDYPLIYNVFGGGNKGLVAGNTNVYFNVGSMGTILGSLYAGGYKGTISGNTYAELAGGLLLNVYGGSREATINGGAHVWAYDGANRAWGEDEPTPEKAPLLIGNLYGGNDISGTIEGAQKAQWTVTPWNSYPAGEIHPLTNESTFSSYVQVGGTESGTPMHKGFPLIGNVFAGGNGVKNTEGVDLPNIAKTLLEVDAGSIVRAFGGGNCATVTESAHIFIKGETHEFTSYEFTQYQKDVLNKTVFNGLYSGFSWTGTRLTLDPNHVTSLFGGNNVAEMRIQPVWNLAKGRLGSVYSGGNMGNMTYYNPAADGTTTRKGLSIDVESDGIYINNLFGGCRMADVKATLYTINEGVETATPQSFSGDDTSDRYGANVFVSGGHIENVYGGNDISGTVYNGTNVRISGAISGNVYGAGNGDYVYAYDTSDKPVESLTERYDEQRGLLYYVVPPNSATTDVEKVRHINTYRPNVERSHLYVEGSESKIAYVKGDVYAGGNSSSVIGTDGSNTDVRFNIGSYVTLNGVYLGSNGADLTRKDYLDNFFEKNGFSVVTTELLDEIMKAVDMNALPKGFDDFGSRVLTNANIGVFCMGGNAGSMTTTKHVTMNFPAGLNIYNRIVGGCNNTDFTYNGATHTGGFNGILDNDQGETKITLNVGCKFTPQYLKILKDEETGLETTASLEYRLGTSPDGKDIFNERRCNVYGGCFTSGIMNGGVEINIKTDMLAGVENQTLDGKAGTTLLKNTNYMKYTSSKSQANIPYVFSVFGGGYGAGTLVNGDIHITMPKYESKPQVNTIYGGSEQGIVVGNTTIEVRNGTVFNSIFGGSDAARLYGSTQTIVGYPTYYRCTESNIYKLTRSDQSDNKDLMSVDHEGRKVIRDYAYYRQGDFIAQNVYETLSTDAERNKFTLVDVAPSWENVKIKIGSGIYGGGFSSAYGAEQSAGTYTICSFTDKYKPSGADATITNYGGNATIMVADAADAEHIQISEKPTNKTGIIRNVLGEGGIFGCGHLVFTQGFKTADVTNYGYAEHTVESPLTLNTFQRLDLLTLRDCCMQLWGARDFAVNKVDARAFSMARVVELNMKSSIDPSTTLNAPKGDPKARNYVCMMNDVHYLGALVTNDSFETGIYHNKDGVNQASTYKGEKMAKINANRGDQDKLAEFKKRNIGTARNLVGINNGYCLKIQNAYKPTTRAVEELYYGPILGVAEVKLLSHQTGEGGGYVYADNLHTYSGNDNDNFLQRQGNFVFPGTDDGNYIVDDCFPTHYENGQTKENEAEGHYWYVEGNKYYFNTVLTGYTYKQEKVFQLDNVDGIVQLSGLGNGKPVALESVWWKSATINDVNGYTGDLRDGTKDYSFKITVGDDVYSVAMPRVDTNINKVGEWGSPVTAINLDNVEDKYNSDKRPAFNLLLTDRVDNSASEYYTEHMEKPEEVLIVMKGRDAMGTECTYYITTIIQYLQGPVVTGDLSVENCALPGELIKVSDSGISVTGDGEMIISDLKWKLLPYHADTGKYSDPVDDDCIDIDNFLDDSRRNLYIPALYKQNNYKVAFTFNAMGEAFSYTGSDKSNLEVHNYHRMKDVEPQNLDPQAGARVYIEDEEDLAAFVTYLNKATLGNDAGIPVGLAGIDVILQNNIAMTASQTVTVPFAGTLHGDGYYIGLPNEQQSLFGSNLSGKTYNLGVVGGSIATAGDRINCFDINTGADALRYGSAAYALSHYFKPGEGVYNPDGYVEQYYANGDYQYAGIRNTDVDANTPYLRTGAPNYGSIETRHDVEHHVDPRRWNETDEINVPLYTAEYDNDYLYFGQHLDLNDADSHPVHISSVAENRVYETAGYHQSGVDDKFHYNLDAWALQPSLTAIDYNNQTVEGDGAATQPTSFNVDSNADYGSYDNSTVGHVSQNLLVYNAGESIFTMSESDNIDESDVVYHNIANGTTANFHLVDKQDFWCPIEFEVTNRTWYERLPQSCREIASAADYHAGSAWEGIALPFTVKDVRGMEEGNLLSHFYGEVANDATAATNDRTLHHEYWLAGMVAASGDKASFERPAVSGTGLFTQAGQASGNYEYQNNYYVNLENYNSHFGTREEDNWYSKAHTFADYVYLTNNVPYLVSFPGESFYEFDLTGQVITFDGVTGLTVPVTVEGETTIGDVSHKASFVHRDSERGVNSDGNAFEQDSPVLPFRTYLAAASHSVPYRVNIVDGMGDIPHGDPQGDEQQEEYVNVYVSGKNIVVESSIKTQLPVYATNGVLLLTIDVEPGITRQPMNTGIYIMPGKKLVVR